MPLKLIYSFVIIIKIKEKSVYLIMDVIIPPAYEVCHGGIMFSSFLCVCVCVSVNNFRVRSITLKALDIFS